MTGVWGTPQERFWRKVDRRSDDECWPWNGAKIKLGYGLLRLGATGHMLAHRFAYLELRGPIAGNRELHHLCENPNCVNPAHLEQVTVTEHRSRHPSYNRLKTHCKHGHEFTPENTYIYAGGKRRCKTCGLRLNKEWRARKAHRATPSAT